MKPKILHCDHHTSDKLYVVVPCQDKFGKCRMITFYGRRVPGKCPNLNLSSIDKAYYDTKAEEVFNKIIREKTSPAKKYRDVEDASYRGPVDYKSLMKLVREKMACHKKLSHIGITIIGEDSKSFENTVSTISDKQESVEFLVRCIDDLGLENFKANMEYLAKASKEKDFYLVQPHGKSKFVSCFAERFEKVV